MNIFEYCTTKTKQGDVGEARAVYEYTRLGYTVSMPLADSAKYDLIVEKDGVIKRVQVKTTKTLETSNFYSVSLKSSGHTSSGNIITPIDEAWYDELFVVTAIGECWMIPMRKIGGKYTITLGDKYNEFKI